ncbi:MAG TPA: class I SAM-dependent methyltransferase [Nocardioidaceae bacterium]|nr:class I SAM-dependent methyltransferase [Nocardioidaceae bacterium]
MEDPVESNRSWGLRQRVGRYSPFVPRRMYDGLARAHHVLALEKRHLEHAFAAWVPPGHFYSPFPDLAEFDKRADELLSTESTPAAIDLREERQLRLFDELAELLVDVPFPVERTDEFRYYFENPAYSWSDGLLLHAMLRHVRPRRVVEVGSGYSSAMLLDTTERWLDPGVELTFVEPYSELLRSLLREGDEERVTILDVGAQDVDLDVFTRLGAGDVLFIDSTHVVKAGSDVNHLFFEVLPSLAAGVVIHIHDIFFPFEYPAEWVREGRAWQESYLLRAFLMYNDAFVIEWFQNLMWSRHRPVLEARVPDMARNAGGNLWLRKVA